MPPQKSIVPKAHADDIVHEGMLVFLAQGTLNTFNRTSKAVWSFSWNTQKPLLKQRVKRPRVRKRLESRMTERLKRELKQDENLPKLKMRSIRKHGKLLMPVRNWAKLT
jgi:hypothetical protein